MCGLSLPVLVRLIQDQPIFSILRGKGCLPWAFSSGAAPGQYVMSVEAGLHWRVTCAHKQGRGHWVKAVFGTQCFSQLPPDSARIISHKTISVAYLKSDC